MFVNRCKHISTKNENTKYYLHKHSAKYKILCELPQPPYTECQLYLHLYLYD